MDPYSVVSLSSLDTEALITGGIVIAFTTILAGIALLQTYSEHHHWNLLREASVAIIIGMIIGLATFAQVLQKVEYENSSKVFFFILLPIIVFKEGYNLNKQHFMKNFLYVIIYGVFGTIFNFIILAALNYSITDSTVFWVPPNPSKTHPDDTQKNSNYAEMFYSACITSKDSAVSLSVLEFEHAPKLHSIIFGEQILNDVIVFALSRTVQDFNKNNQSGNWYNTFIFIGTILLQLLVGFLVGVVVGFLATWITKKSRFLSEHSSVCTAFTIYMAYFSFSLCEAFDFCGVLAVLICGIMLSHYQSYNLPKISCTSSRITIKALAYVSETIIYFYIGYMVTNTEIVGREEDSSIDYQVFTFILLQLFVFSPIARVCSMLLAYGAALLFRMKTKGPWRINKYEFFILFYSGLIKGVVAYALICEQEVGGTDYYKIIQTTSLFMVVGTTLLNGGTLKYVCEWAYKRMEDDNLITTRPISETSQQQMRKTFIQEDTKAYKKLNHKSEKMFKNIDENYIKPFLIYKYVERKNDIILAKQLERNKNRFEKEQEMKMFDDSVRQQREQFEEHKQKKQNHVEYEPVHVDSGSDDEEHDQTNKHLTNSDVYSRNGSNGFSQH